MTMLSVAPWRFRVLRSFSTQASKKEHGLGRGLIKGQVWEARKFGDQIFSVVSKEPSGFRGTTGTIWPEFAALAVG